MMDTNDMNTPRPESGGEERSSGRTEGKRPQNRGHHRRGRGRSQGGNNAAATADKTAQAQTPSPEAPPPATPLDGQGPSQGQGQGQKKQGRNRSGKQSAGKQQPAKQQPQKQQPAKQSGKQQAPKPQPANPRPEQVAEAPAASRSRHSTGRPQRNVRRNGGEAELPNMENLLIEDNVTPATPAPSDGEVDPAVIERILSRDIFEHPCAEIPAEIPEGKVLIVGIRFRPGGKTYFFDPCDWVCPVGSYAIVETAHGLEFGEVCLSNRLMDESAVIPPLRPVVRPATDEDIRHNKENREKEAEAFRIGVQKIAEHRLDMKLVEVQYTFDNSKLLFYFTSEKRVDFRELVRDLAGVFHLRIELRQIGIRDEARMIGGLGICGRPLCCTTFLSDFGQVSMKMAKEQNLSLNSTKISGCCGRLMCCLRYEHEVYAAEIKAMPTVGTAVNTPDGPGSVTEVFVLKGEVKVTLFGKPDTPPKKYKRDQIEIQSRERRQEAPAPDPADPEPLPPTEEESEDEV